MFIYIHVYIYIEVVVYLWWMSRILTRSRNVVVADVIVAVLGTVIAILEEFLHHAMKK